MSVIVAETVLLNLKTSINWFF